MPKGNVHRCALTRRANSSLSDEGFAPKVLWPWYIQAEGKQSRADGSYAVDSFPSHKVLSEETPINRLCPRGDLNPHAR